MLAAKSYAKGWLPVDFVSCLPFGYIPYVLGEGEGGAGGACLIASGDGGGALVS